MWLRGGLVGPSACAQCPLVETGRVRDSASPRWVRPRGRVLHSGQRQVPHRGAASGLCGLNSRILSACPLPSSRSPGLRHAHTCQPSQPAQNSASTSLASSKADSACEALRGLRGRGRGLVSHGGVTCRCNPSNTQLARDFMSIGAAMVSPRNVEQILPSQRVEPGMKRCNNPSCNQVMELRFFKPSMAMEDGYLPMCRGCKYRLDTLRRFVNRYKMTKKEALLNLERRFGGPDQLCSKCYKVLPPSFYYIASYICISCKSEMEQDRAVERRKLRLEIPRKKRCTVCKKMLPKEQYHKCLRHPTGLTSYCISCHRKAVTSTTSAYLENPIPKELHVAHLRCTCCWEVKHRSEFPMDRTKTQSRFYECKECCSTHRIAKRIRQLAEHELALAAAAEAGISASTPALLPPYKKKRRNRAKASATPPSAAADGSSDEQER